ncbi:MULTISPECIES: hypothetical protein [Halomicrobium]|uniref:DUF8048 domain-containing protein n=2 Tax=Halomicrobium mukohataei TaxID=57705 RepID=C7NXG8_HALMD|nr:MULTISPECIES: hypothetical protein [Halomicrobium]ACV48402.1 conserved hypothetical protein [Halomicrobium mukohataei DSM 12286]QCD66810.1 hypothetical protein E5139_14585 [Halomicrobium mukohataei]QFR21620.1 hypothetical protein GBQ70_14600 [Halomicrobium sp. ZPS1]
MESADSDLFDTAAVERSASEFEVDPAALTQRLADHQAAVEELPGVENIVYEWRKQYEDPLIERTAGVYYLRVPSTVWDEFGDALGVGDAMLGAVVDVHRRTVSTASGVSSTPPDGVAYVALDRTL